MTVEEIKAAVEAGKRVFWVNEAYEVLEDRRGEWLIKCHANGSCIGLTWMDGVTMNGAESEFFVG